jgi:hypothetical protein
MSLLNVEQVTGRTGKVVGREMLASNSTRNNLAVLARLTEERQLNEHSKSDSRSARQHWS